MIRRPPRSTLDRSSAASDVYKRQEFGGPSLHVVGELLAIDGAEPVAFAHALHLYHQAVSYTHLRAHETVLDLVCRLLLEKKKKQTYDNYVILIDTVLLT